MKDLLVDLLENTHAFAFLFSMLINVIISILGFVPSIFLTAANLVVFGFWEGTLVSFIGEGVGAVISFVLYRKGLRKLSEKKAFHHPKVRRLLEVEGAQAFSIVLSLRLLPFVPSGVVTFFAAVGKMSLLVFAVASTLGKAPALLLEAYSANQLIQWTWQGKAIVTLFGGCALALAMRRLYRKKSRD